MFLCVTLQFSNRYFLLTKEYAVIFLYRHKSLEPFARHFSSEELLSSLIVQNNTIQGTVRLLIPII